MSEDFEINESIQLDNAIMIVGLSGWGNAGEISTFTVKYLAEKLGANKLGEIPAESFHDYMVQRPMVSISEGVIQSYLPPRNDLFYCRGKDGKLDLVLLVGDEPHLNWPKYVGIILRLAEKMAVKRIYTVGGYLADIHYRSETPIAASTNNKRLIAELKKLNVELTSYSGPTSVYGEILWRAREKSLDVVSLWCGVPLYISGLYPKAAYHMLQKIIRLTGMELDLTDLRKRVESSEVRYDKEVIDQPQLRGMIESMNKRGQRKEPTYRV